MAFKSFELIHQLRRDCGITSKGFFVTIISYLRDLFSDSVHTAETLDENTKKYEEEIDEHIKERFNGNIPQFNVMLAQHLRDRNITQTELDHRSLVDHKFISKIVNTNGYVPKVCTVMQMALGLHLSLEEYEEFMYLAGYAADMPGMTGIIVRFCIIKGKTDESYYDIENKVNFFLKAKNQKVFDYHPRKEPRIDVDKCTGCGKCAKKYPKIYEMKENKATIIVEFSAKIGELNKSAKLCPKKAIEIV